MLFRTDQRFLKHLRVGYGGGYGGGQSRYGDGGGYAYTAKQTGGKAPTFTPPAPRPSAPARPVTPPPKAAPAPCTLEVGDVVEHPSFGTGIIQSKTAMAGDTLLVVQFKSVGQKKLMANYAKLTKV